MQFVLPKIENQSHHSLRERRYILVLHLGVKNTRAKSGLSYHDESYFDVCSESTSADLLRSTLLKED